MLYFEKKNFLVQIPHHLMPLIRNFTESSVKEVQQGTQVTVTHSGQKITLRIKKARSKTSFSSSFVKIDYTSPKIQIVFNLSEFQFFRISLSRSRGGASCRTVCVAKSDVRI